MSKKVKRESMNELDLPKCWGSHTEKSKLCLNCCIAESCFAYKEM